MHACRIGLTMFVPILAVAQTSPPRRAHHALVYDEANERVLLTGGSSPRTDGECCETFNDLWAFDGARWTQLALSGTPMSGMRLAYDGRSRRVVSFGGFSEGRSLADLRTLEGHVWTTLGQLAEMPTAEGGFVFDSRRDRFVAFGGSPGGGRAHGDTWEYDGGRWTKVALGGPAARQAFGMVFDERRGRTVVFGGSGVSNPPARRPMFADVWEFDGQQWVNLTVPEGPSPRQAVGVAYDSKRGRLILFGGLDSTGFRADTWAFADGRWTRLADSSPDGPEPRAMGALAYDKKRDRVVLFGGRKGWPNGDLNDTWEFDGTIWRRVDS